MADGDRNREDAEFFEMSLDHLCVAGFDGYWKRLNPSWFRTLGWTADEMMSRPVVEFAHPDDRAMVLASRQQLRQGAPLRNLTNRYRCRDGSYRWFEWICVADVERQLVYGVARDVTEGREAQRTLRDLSESLTATLNSIADGVIATGPDSAVARMNPVAEELTGWSLGDAQGKPLAAIFPLVDAAVRSPDMARLRRRDGAELPIAFRRAPLRDAEDVDSGEVIVFRDRTAEVTAKEVQDGLQRQLMLADRLASVGTLAAGVAHEINNPLGYVMANLDVVLEEMQGLAAGRPPGDAAGLSHKIAEWRTLAAEARQGADRIRKIVRGLMTFSRSDEERRAIIDVKPVLELSVSMSQNEIRHRARLVRDYGATPLVEADESRLGQVFINLLVNAAQAIPEGHGEENEIRIVTSTDAAGRAVVEILDTGPGIPESLMGRIFDPFFTTKPIGVGTGLGLSICHGIIQSLGGELTAHNREGRGAVFRVVLPLAIGQPHEVPVAPVRAPSRRAVVLVVDDEVQVAVSLARVLRSHDVTTVTSAREALALVASGRTFDIILSDVMMPGMSGMDLYEELARDRPELARRVVFVTGGAFSPSAHAFLDSVSNIRLEKPFDAARVRRIVARFAEGDDALTASVPPGR